MNYYEVKLDISPNEESYRDVLAAVLGDIDFESFVETPSGLNAYVTEKSYNLQLLDDTISSFPIEGVKITYSTDWIESEDWNSEWEKNFFQPIIVDNQCVIHSSFHTDIPALPYDIMIDPKMAFGTGHHETTSLMISFLLGLNVENKSFLDMGCGTAILAILAKMRGAGYVIAIDNDEWAYNNSIENISLNNTPEITVQLGDANLLGKDKFDIIFANINRNILLNDIPTYASVMNKNAELFMSGFYLEDIPLIQKACDQQHLQYKEHLEKNNWVAVRFVKTEK